MFSYMYLENLRGTTKTASNNIGFSSRLSRSGGPRLRGILGKAPRCFVGFFGGSKGRKKHPLKRTAALGGVISGCRFFFLLLLLLLLLGVLECFFFSKALFFEVKLRVSW